ncbi:hypothetical protein [Actinoplanes sp. HUAS TT8]|uniref:hypothetical protein n=1 Tax=Actinoplanes sp. HUAS TT8 TaxID=3447453 RepID=UPI003F526E96
MLVRRLHPSAQAIDGSGGDGGRDIAWNSPDGLVVFEVKSYTSRLGSTQRRNIRDSLTTASQHDPAQWILILPLDPTPAEEAWFNGLRKDFSPTDLQWRGRDWLGRVLPIS